MQNMFFEREDWKLFRNMETLPQKAGVPRSKLSRLVCKELTDNALDLGSDCEIGYEGDFFYVKDHGGGLDPELFSINRPLRSSKYLRLPTRGALGNGLRVVAGAVVASGGELYVSTRGKNYKIHFQNDGTAFPESLGDYHEAGTKIRFTLGGMPIDSSWASLAMEYAQGETYRGKTSPYWYTSENFFELFQSYSGSVRELITQFDGCTGGKAGKIAAEYTKTSAAALAFDETEALLAELRAAVKNVSPERLGRIGKLDRYSGYCKSAGTFKARTVKGEHDAEIAFVLEVYAIPSDTPHITVLLNKSPVTGNVNIHHSKNLLSIFGCGLTLYVKAKPAVILINIITPYIPIVTDGKEPDLSVISDAITESIQKAVSRAQKSLPGDVVERKKSQKEVVAACLEQAIAKASGNGEYRFSLRQLYYAVRPYVIKESGKEPDYAYFCTELIGSYEAQYGDIPLMYRDERGTLYHPHSGQDIPIGTIAVENYQKPVWTFNKILYIEKEGFFNVLKEKKIPEKYDMALLTSKGYASRAVKDLLDALGENSEEEITFFCIHDADAYGTTIYDTLQNETKARPGRKVKIINLGLDPEEAVSMGLEIEKAGKKGRRKGVASYIDPEWESWLQNYRVELNAMSTPQFLAWLEGRIRLYDKGKVIPPESTMLESLDHSLQDKLGQKLVAEILEQNHYADQVIEAVRQVKERCGDSQTRLAETVQAELKKEPVNLWKDVIKAVSEDMIKNCRF
jgi:hypothetical protein